MSSEENLLNRYKKYDYLNQNKKTPLVKILVSYVKPSFLFKSEILTPIHLGKAVETESTKDGIITEDDITWLNKNCINDNFKDGISKHNRRIGFLTGTYWAWKNYEKLGNPEYFGSFGYRRLLSEKFLDDINNLDFVISPMRKVLFRLNTYGANLYKHMIDVFGKYHPDEVNIYEKYLQRKYVYYDEIYVFKKEQFFKFCEWIFPMLFELLKINPHEFAFNINDNSFNNILKQKRGEQRDIAYITERLTGYYIWRLTKDKNLKYKKVKLVSFKKRDDNNTEKQRETFNNIILPALRLRHLKGKDNGQ